MHFLLLFRFYECFNSRRKWLMRGGTNPKNKEAPFLMPMKSPIRDRKTTDQAYWFSTLLLTRTTTADKVRAAAYTMRLNDMIRSSLCLVRALKSTQRSSERTPAIPHSFWVVLLISVLIASIVWSIFCLTSDIFSLINYLVNEESGKIEKVTKSAWNNQRKLW